MNPVVVTESDSNEAFTEPNNIFQIQYNTNKKRYIIYNGAFSYEVG